MMRMPLLMLSMLGLAILPLILDDQDQRTVGTQADGRVLVPTNQFLTPAGRQATFPGRPVDLALLDDGRLLVAKSMNELVFIDTAAGAVRQRLATPAKGQKRPGLSATGILAFGDQVLVTDAEGSLRIASRRPGGAFEWEKVIQVRPPKEGAAYPTGLARHGPEHCWVCCSRNNSVQLLNLREGTVEAEVSVGVAPFAVAALSGEDTIYVSNWGGDPPRPADPRADSSGTPIRIDPRTGVANHGSVSVVQRVGRTWKQTSTIEVGLHPCALVVRGSVLLVANANSDTVSVINRRGNAVVATLNCRPEARLPFGSGPCALALSADARRLFVANATNNAIMVLDFPEPLDQLLERGRPIAARQAGLIPTGWYPGALTLSPDGLSLFVANLKGVGSLSRPRAVQRGMNSHDHLGSVSLISLPNAADLAKQTEQVRKNNRQTLAMAGLEPPRKDAPPVPLPERHGEPSLFRHVIYIIKENRTYDQVLGGLKEGRGDPRLVLYGEEITPNHHALAREFTLFDNFYCSGVLSADGHTWCNEAYVGDYIERAFGGFTRSYPDSGQDPLAYAAFGFLWDNALAHGKTFRNYGEYVSHVNEPKDATWFDLYADLVNQTEKVKVKVEANLASLKPYTHPRYSWWPPDMPDVYRAKLFLDELKEFERKGEFPNLVYLTLPCDHAMGMDENYPTARAMVADNDLALGRIVEGLTRSRFWPHLCIFVVEDDPQDGFDHIDSHRTVAYVISPYTRRKFVDRTCYNQTGLVKSIELILGLPPMNQLDLTATPMRGCFQDRPDPTPYACRPNRIPLDERNKKKAELRGEELEWFNRAATLNLKEIDAAEEDLYNRLLWFLAKGARSPYPVGFTRLGRGQEKED